jgi:hypothetical protein
MDAQRIVKVDETNISPERTERVRFLSYNFTSKRVASLLPKTSRNALIFSGQKFTSGPGTKSRKT